MSSGDILKAEKYRTTYIGPLRFMHFYMKLEKKKMTE
jgi:hypothetical protein